MNAMLRKLRGAFGLALTWAVGWGITGFALIAVMWVVAQPEWPFFRLGGPFALLAAGSGFLAGGAFAGLLGTVHRKKRLADLSAKRMAIWGAAAGAILPVALTVGSLLLSTGLDLRVIGIMGLGITGLGAATGGGLVALAKAGEGELFSGGEAESIEPGPEA